jgi:hypothetical protein
MFNLFILANLLAVMHIFVQQATINKQQAISFTMNYILLLSVGIAGIYKGTVYLQIIWLILLAGSLGYGITGLSHFLLGNAKCRKYFYD